jgi:serine/threonine protein kinase
MRSHDAFKISGHPNVMEVLDFFEVPMPAFIMRFVASGDLRDYLNKKGKFSGKQRENGRPYVRRFCPKPKCCRRT